MDKLNRAKQRQDNEFYTKYIDVETIVENTKIKDYLKDKIVYLPCDGEWSQIYKYMTDNKDRLHIKEILRTSDDYYGHDDLYKRCDVVFTNPPFTGLKKWLNWLESNNLKYIVWAPMMNLGLYHDGIDLEKTRFVACQDAGGVNVYVGDRVIKRDKEYRNFYSPSGDKGVNVFILSNIDSLDDYEHAGHAFTKTFNDVKDKLFMIDGSYEVSNSQLIPSDYYGQMLIPFTAYVSKKKYFDYLDKKVVFCKDNKRRLRILVKRVSD